MPETIIQYLARDKVYESEKPYSADFEVEEDDGVKRTNYVLVKELVFIHAIKHREIFSLDINGFCVLNAKTDLDPQLAIADPNRAEEPYLTQLKSILSNAFPEFSRFEAMEFVVSCFVFG